MIKSNELLDRARSAREHAYAPYSGFMVGAAVLARDGRIFAGCNVENASYGLTTCAERNALCAAITAGCKPGDLIRIAVIGDTGGPISPCGSCRQLIHELGGRDIDILLANLAGDSQHTRAEALLPGAFNLEMDKPA